MKFFLYLAVGALAAAVPSVHADDKIVLQLKSLHQAQFAGYYAAQKNGYYADEGLEVEIRAGGPGQNAPAEVAAAGVADVIVEWMPAALHARERGIPLVNIAQPFRYSGAELTCLRSSGIRTLDDLRGETIGHWLGPDRLQVVSLLQHLGISVAEAGTRQADYGAVLKGYADPIYGLKSGIVSCISTASYGSSLLLSRAGFKEDELITFNYQHLGVATLQDGLYVMEGRLEDAAFSDAMVRFVRASMRGWRWAEQNQKKAALLAMQVIGVGGSEQEELQHHIMRKVAQLTDGANGALVIDDYERTAEILLFSGVLPRAPQGAWTSDITDRARIYEEGRFARLLAAAQGWGKELVLSMLNPEYFMTHIYNFLLLASMMMRRMVLLRVIFMLAMFTAILNDFFWRQHAGSLFWSLLLLAANAIQLAYISTLSRLIKMSSEEEEFVSVHFPNLDKVNARRLIRRGEFGVAGEEHYACRRNERVSHIYFLLSGSCTIGFLGEKPAPVILGNIPVMEALPSTIDIKIHQGSRYWRIDAQVVRKSAKYPTVISNALYQSFSRDGQSFLKGVMSEHLTPDSTSASAR